MFSPYIHLHVFIAYVHAVINYYELYKYSTTYSFINICTHTQIYYSYIYTCIHTAVYWVCFVFNSLSASFILDIISSTNSFDDFFTEYLRRSHWNVLIRISTKFICIFQHICIHISSKCLHLFTNV